MPALLAEAISMLENNIELESSSLEPQQFPTDLNINPTANLPAIHLSLPYDHDENNFDGCDMAAESFLSAEPSSLDALILSEEQKVPVSMLCERLQCHTSLDKSSSCDALFSPPSPSSSAFSLAETVTSVTAGSDRSTTNGSQSHHSRKSNAPRRSPSSGFADTIPGVVFKFHLASSNDSGVNVLKSPVDYSAYTPPTTPLTLTAVHRRYQPSQSPHHFPTSGHSNRLSMMPRPSSLVANSQSAPAPTSFPRSNRSIAAENAPSLLPSLSLLTAHVANETAAGSKSELFYTVEEGEEENAGATFPWNTFAPRTTPSYPVSSPFSDEFSPKFQKKKKKMVKRPRSRARAIGEKVCFSCKTMQTPIWREVKETWGDGWEDVLLCNACGLRTFCLAF